MAFTTPFRPYGLIRSPIEQALYRRAHIANVYTGIANPKEYETVALMETLLYNYFTTRDNFSVNSQQPPTPNSARRCDIVIRYLESETQDIRALCFAECKRTSTSQAFSLLALERQAYEYCQLYIEYQAVRFVYAATMAGAHIRLWRCSSERASLVPFWGTDNEGDWQQYKDVGNDNDGREIQLCFERMKEFPPTPHAGQTSDSYGTSGQGISSSYQANAPPRPLAPSAYPFAPSGTQPGISSNASLPGYQLSASGARPGPYTVSYATSSTASGGAYLRSHLTTQTNTSVQPGEEVDDNDEDEGDREDEEDEEDEGDEEMEVDAVSSRSAPTYRVVQVTRRVHTIGSNEYIFVDAKGKARSTRRSQWSQIVYNGQPCWRYHHYVCTQNVFR